MGTRENKNTKIVNLRHPRKFKPMKMFFPFNSPINKENSNKERERKKVIM